MNDTSIIIFPTQAAAVQAVIAVSAVAIPPGNSTILVATPLPLVDGRWYLNMWPIVGDWLQVLDHTSYVTASGTGTTAVGENSLASTTVECLALRDRFTNTELGTMTIAASTTLAQGDPRLQILIDTMGAAVQLNLTDPRVQFGFQSLVAAGILTAARANTILAPIGILS